jgi:hypothetical protein
MIWVLNAVLGLAAGLNIWMAIQNYRLGKKLQKTGIPPEVLADIHRFVATQIGLDVDLVERVLTDLAFLHGELYSSTHEEQKGHECPTCRSTVPDLERLLNSIRSLQMHVEKST